MGTCLQSIAGDTGLIPGQGTKILRAMWHSHKKRKEKKKLCHCRQALFLATLYTCKIKKFIKKFFKIVSICIIRLSESLGNLMDFRMGWPELFFLSLELGRVEYLLVYWSIPVGSWYNTPVILLGHASS